MGYTSVLNSPAFPKDVVTFTAMLSLKFKNEIYDDKNSLFPQAAKAYDFSKYAGANTLTMAASAAASLAALYLYWE